MYCVCVRGLTHTLCYIYHIMPYVFHCKVNNERLSKKKNAYATLVPCVWANFSLVDDSKCVRLLATYRLSCSILPHNDGERSVEHHYRVLPLTVAETAHTCKSCM